MKKYKLTFPALIDPEGTIRESYGTTGIPESFIIDQRGILVEKIIGPINWAFPEVYGFFRNLIQKPLPEEGNVSYLKGEIVLAYSKNSQSYSRNR